MYQQEYYVPKKSGTLADALLAYGVAVILQQLLLSCSNARRRGSVYIKDTDSHYIIVLAKPVQKEWLEQSAPLSDVAWAIKRKGELPDGVPTLDYQTVWEEISKQRALRDEQRKLRSSTGQQAVQELEESFYMQRYRQVTLLIGDYRLQVERIHNQAVIQWYETVQTGHQATNLRAILQMFATPHSDIDAAVKIWASEVKLQGMKRYLTVSQVYNPGMGKGQNHAKPDKLTHGENLQSFWLLEYLKVVGLFAAAAPCIFTDSEKKRKEKRSKPTRKTYVLAPYNIDLETHQDIFKRLFEPTFYGLSTSPIKADILASLQYASAYLSYCREARFAGQEAPDLNPRKSIKGFYTATYVLLSENSYTMTHLAFLGLPSWLYHIDTHEDVAEVQQVIEEHKRLIRPLEEQFQEGSELLSAYREFLTGNQVDAFFEFCAGYGEHVVHTLLTTPRVGQYSIASLDNIFRRIAMLEQGSISLAEEENKDDLTEFSYTPGEHPGFHRIASAIRHSTIIPQRQNANHESGQRAEKSLYTVRYGLGHNLLRKAYSAQEFMEALTEFVHDYNAETDQVYEKTSKERKPDPHTYAQKHYRPQVFLSDLDDVLALVKEYGPSLVCKMLVAYGYAAVGQRGADRRKTGGDDENESASEYTEHGQEGMNS